jgi:hypothetical protein
MPDPQLLLLASDLRARGEQLLARAESMDVGAQLTMREIAECYEKSAQRVEHHAEEA